MTFNTDVTITPGSYVNGASSTIAFAITNGIDIPDSGKISLEIPKRFDDDSIIEQIITSADTAVASVVDNAGTTDAVTTEYTVSTNYQPSSSAADTITITLVAGTSFPTANAPYTITLSGCTMPYSLEASQAFIVSTQDSNGVDIEQLVDGLITMVTGGTMTSGDMSISPTTIA
jgi:hypothetical protein